MRREAELSSVIESTYARIQTLLLFEHIPSIAEQTPDVREMENNFRALEYGLASVTHRPISLGLIQEMHEILLKDVRGNQHTPGSFRQVQAHLGRSNRIDQARFVPAPPHEIDPAMRQLEQYIQQRNDLPALARLAITHYQFEAIHPLSRA